ncbi:hypothetical protein [Streptomyces sp. WZ-12]|uniref:hypothetical protein n=1 Tax=Streptomyces sp. WZ-12 TaxID=3030210 RepID=UPI002381337E|nr:hypothetical protein [Streptomyces sp. WZ-12]
MSQNDPRLDGTSHPTPDTLDYQRLTEATDMTVEWDIHVDGGTRAAASKRFDMNAVDKLAMKRADETSGLWSTPSPRADEILRNFIHVWSEGLMHGIVFVEQRKTTSIFGKLPDHNLLGATNSIIGGHWSHDREQQWARRIDPKTMVHVAQARSTQAVQMLKLDRPDPLKLRSAHAAQWEDGFLMGFLFAELGGHRDD